MFRLHRPQPNAPRRAMQPYRNLYEKYNEKLYDFVDCIYHIYLSLLFSWYFPPVFNAAMHYIYTLIPKAMNAITFGSDTKLAIHREFAGRVAANTAFKHRRPSNE